MRISGVTTVAASALFLIGVAASAPALAQKKAPPAWVASPDVYKVIGESDKFRIIRASWQPGQRDKPHSHKPLGTYFLNDCQVRLYEGGKSREGKPQAGKAFIQKPIREHALENIGGTVCDMVIFELK